MTFQNADRVEETSITTGTGVYSLLGPTPSKRNFVSGVGNGNTCDYVAVSEDEAGYEYGVGTVTDGAPDTLARTLITGSSAGGSAVNWGAGTKRIFCANLASRENPKAIALGSDHAISSVTGTEVAGLEFANVLPGTYIFEYFLIIQSATLTVGPMLGINFSGTAAVRKMCLRYPSTGTTAITGVADDVGAATGQIMECHPVTAFSTTAPNMGHNGGVATVNADILDYIEGIMIVTAIGNLELWHASETATSTTVKAGSVARLTRAA